MSLAALWRFLVVALPVLSALLATLQSVDLTYQIRAGHEILSTGRIPTVDTWTFTANGQPWFDQQWGAQVIFALIERVGGWTGLVVVRALIVGMVFASLAFIARRRGLSDRTTAVLVLAALVVAAPALALRPQLLGMACFAIVLLLVTARRDHPRLIWAVPLVVAVWANLHGSFFLGPVVLGLAWIEDVHDGVPQPHRALVIAVISALAACLTPFGPWVWVYALGVSTKSRSHRSDHRVATHVLARCLGCALLRLGGRRRGRARPPRPHDPMADVAVAARLLRLGGVRGPWCGLVAIGGGGRDLGLIGSSAVVAPAASGSGPDASAQPWHRRLPGRRGDRPAAVLATDRLLGPGRRSGSSRMRRPASRRRFATSCRPAPRLQSTALGLVVRYAVPDALVAIDSRIDVFSAGGVGSVRAVVAGRTGWQQQLDAWAVTIFVAEAGTGRIRSPRSSARDGPFATRTRTGRSSPASNILVGRVRGRDRGWRPQPAGSSAWK